jgi:Domain of unknown function (DUF4350)
MSRKHILLIVLCFVALPIIAWIAETGNSSDPTRFTSSTYSVGPKGAKALYLVLEELGVNVMRFRRSMVALASHHGTMVVYNPKKLPISKREVSRLKTWVRKGNKLVIICGKGGMPAGICAGSCSLFSLRSALKYFGLYLKTGADESRTKFIATLPGIPGKLRAGTATDTRWKKPSKVWTILASDKAGPILLSREMGRGEITALCDPTIFSNEHIRQDQNLRLALAVLLRPRRPREVLFDEYHHGHAMADTFWSYVGSSIFSWILLQTALGLGLFFYSRRSANAGRFRSLAQPRGRSTMEYISSMANILETCQAGSAALEVVLKRFVGQISRRLGVPARILEQGRLPAGALAKGPADEAIKLIKECRKVIRLSEDSDETVNLARQLAELRGKIMHAARTR